MATRKKKTTRNTTTKKKTSVDAKPKAKPAKSKAAAVKKTPSKQKKSSKSKITLVQKIPKYFNEKLNIQNIDKQLKNLEDQVLPKEVMKALDQIEQFLKEVNTKVAKKLK